MKIAIGSDHAGFHLKEQADSSSRSVGSLDGFVFDDMFDLPLILWNIRADIEMIGEEDLQWSPGQLAS